MSYTSFGNGLEHLDPSLNGLASSSSLHHDPTANANMSHQYSDYLASLPGYPGYSMAPSSNAVGVSAIPSHYQLYAPLPNMQQQSQGPPQPILTPSLPPPVPHHQHHLHHQGGMGMPAESSTTRSRPELEPPGPVPEGGRYSSAKAAAADFRATDTTQHACPYEGCDKSFARKSDFLRHYRIHTEERPYACEAEGCDKSFIQRSALTVHARVHTGDRPHVCPECSHKFSDSSSLARHRRVHAGLKPFACEKCNNPNKTFSRKATLRRHQGICKGPAPAGGSGEKRKRSRKTKRASEPAEDDEEADEDGEDEEEEVGTSLPALPVDGSSDVPGWPQPEQAPAWMNLTQHASLDQQDGEEDGGDGAHGGRRSIGGTSMQMLVKAVEGTIDGA